MTTTKTLTANETRAIAHAARRVVGVSWDYMEAASLKGMLAEAIADDHNERLEVLLALGDGCRYELCDTDGDVIREATVAETIDSVMAGAEGLIEVDGQTCYVDFN